MHQIGKLISLRFIQTFRLIKQTGIGITILALFLMTGVILSAIENLLSIDQIYSLISVPVIIFAIDKIRADKDFLINLLGGKRSMGRYLSIEYLLIFLPLVLYKLISKQYLIGLALIGTVILLSFFTTLLSKPTTSGYKKPFKSISLQYFELKFYVEKHRLGFLSIILLLFLGAVHVSLWILGIFVLISFIIEIFAAQEPMEMIRWKPKFVAIKIFKYFKIATPLLILTSAITYICSGLSLFVFLYGICAILTTIALAISNKYAEYYGLTDRIKTNLTVTIIAFFMLLPGFIVVTIIYTIIKYKKAESQMKYLCSI